MYLAPGFLFWFIYIFCLCIAHLWLVDDDTTSSSASSCTIMYLHVRWHSKCMIKMSLKINAKKRKLHRLKSINATQKFIAVIADSQKQNQPLVWTTRICRYSWSLWRINWALNKSAVLLKFVVRSCVYFWLNNSCCQRSIMNYLCRQSA